MPGGSDLPGYLRHLSPVRRGQKIKEALTADRINAIQDAIHSIARGENIIQGANVKKRSGDSWVMLTADKGSKSAPSLTQIGETPFEVIPISDNSGNVTKIGVINNSHLLNSEDRDSYEDNSNWGTDLLNEEQTLGGFDISGVNFGDKIWLEIRLNSDQSIAQVTIRHGAVGGTNPWDEFPNPISINTDDPANPYQEFYNQIIAEVTDPNQDARSGFLIQKGAVQMQVTQLLFTNLMLVEAHTAPDADQPNLPLVVATAWNGPATGTSGDGGVIAVGNDIMTPWVFGELTADDNPFQVVSITYPNGSSQVGVVSNSHLFNSEDEDSYEEPNLDWGLLDSDRSTGWFDAGNPGDKIWLQISLNQDQSIDAIDIMHGPTGSNWPNYPDPVLLNTVDPNNVFQSQYNQIIAEVTAPDSDPRPGIQVGDVQVTQLLRTNLMMVTAHTTLNATHSDVPLIVALAWNGPATSFDGNATEISNFANVTTPWALGDADSNRNDYSFRLSDATDDTGPKVLVTDGEVNGQLPQGMGGGDFIMALPNDDLIDPGTSGENDVYLEITHDIDGAITSLSISAVSPANLPESSFGNKIILLGYILVHKESLGSPMVTEIHNTQLGDVNFNLFPNKYGFQMFDASDEHSNKVLIMDGKVNGIDGSDHIPQGMGNDDYIIVVENDWDVWLNIPYDPDTFEILDPVSIAAGSAIPTDTIVGGVGFSYVQIGYVDIDPPVVTPHNSLCGDYDFGNSSVTPEIGMNTYSFKMRDESIGSTPRIQILDGNVIDVDGAEHTPIGMGDDEFVVQVADDDAIYMVIVYNRQTGAIIDPVTIGIGNAPDDSPGRQIVEIGYVNVSFSAGGDAIIIPHNTLCGDYQFALDDGEIGFSFQMLDASDTSGNSPVYKVRLLDGNVIDSDGNEHLPSGMGNDDLIVSVFNDYTVYMAIPHDADWNITAPIEIFASVSPPPDSPTVSYIDIGYVNVDPDGELIIRNVLCGDFDFEPPTSMASGNNYSFQMLNASDISGTKVLILDGQVFGPSDNGILPSGMGGDNFVITVDNNDEVWLIITIDNDTGLITSVTIDKGPTTPEDTTATKYVTIGYISTDSSGIVHPTNALLGDYSLPYTLDVTGHDDDLNDVNVDGVTQVNVLGAATIRHDPFDPNPNAVDVIIGPDVSDSVVTIDNPSLITFTRESTVAGRIVEDGGNGEVVVHVPTGVDVAGTEGGNFDNAELITFDRATVSPGGDQEVIVTITGRIDVSDASTTIDNAELIHFEGASISSGGGSEVIVAIVQTVDLAGNNGSLDNIELIHFEGANISNQGGGEALVSIIGMVDLADNQGHALDNRELITFVGATIQDGGGGEAIVTITPGGGINVEGDTTTGTTNSIQLLTFQGADVSGPGNGEAVIQITSQGSGFNVEGDTGAAGRINQPTLLHFTGASVSQPATGEADISITGTIDVAGDATTANLIELDNAQLITFHGAPVGVYDGGGGEVIVEITGMIDIEADNGTQFNGGLIQFPGAFVNHIGSAGEGLSQILEVDYTGSFGVDVSDLFGNRIDNSDSIIFNGTGVDVGYGGGRESIVNIDGVPFVPNNGATWFLVGNGTDYYWGPSVSPGSGTQLFISINGSPGFALRPPSSGTYVLASTNGSVNWMSTSNC